MIEVTATAQSYLQNLIDQQDENGLGLRVSVNQPGGPNASCDLQFCPEGQNQDDDKQISFSGFNLYVAAASEKWLESAQVDFDEDATGGQLSIKAPGIKGSEPAADAPIEKRLQWLLDFEINPSLASHGGRVSLLEITQDMDVVLEFGGGCQGCGMADVTLKQGIEQTLVQKIPEIRNVVDSTDHQGGTNPYYAAGVSGQSAV
jgi:Fe/S biogenesis protein NfuA